jgi:hypothetical protein
MELPVGLCYLMQTARGKQKDTAFNTVHSLRSFGALALLSVLIAGPAFIIIRLLEPGLILPALSILLFLACSDRRVVAVSIHADSNPKNVILWDTLR